jgi:hypothetical protein
VAVRLQRRRFGRRHGMDRNAPHPPRPPPTPTPKPRGSTNPQRPVGKKKRMPPPVAVRIICRV